MNQALLKSKAMEQYALEAAEKIEICYDVRCEGNGSNVSNSNVLGRFLISNYRIRFIENGKRENQHEHFYSCSIPFGCI
jgi:hypothetical protein